MDKKIERKIALGTVQFGLDYGINNPKGKISFEDAGRIIDHALSHGIDTIDTAAMYGESEVVLGRLFQQQYGNIFKIISKLPPVNNSQEVEQALFNSLKNLKTDSIYGYLFHDFKTFEKDPKVIVELNNLKEQGYLQKLGFSLYYPDQLSYLLENNVSFDLLQVPYNVLDRRFEPFFPILKARGIEIHTRSVFLQGLLLIDPEKLDIFFSSIKDKLERLRALEGFYNIPLNCLLLLFALKNEDIDRVVIGVDSLENLKANMIASNFLREYSEVEFSLDRLQENNEEILLPFNWKI